MQNTAYPKPLKLEFNSTDVPPIFLKDWRNALVIKNVKKLKFQEDWAELRPKNILLRQSYAKYLEQIREIQ